MSDQKKTFDAAAAEIRAALDSLGESPHQVARVCVAVFRVDLVRMRNVLVECVVSSIDAHNACAMASFVSVLNSKMPAAGRAALTRALKEWKLRNNREFVFEFLCACLKLKLIESTPLLELVVDMCENDPADAVANRLGVLLPLLSSEEREACLSLAKKPPTETRTLTVHDMAQVPGTIPDLSLDDASSSSAAAAEEFHQLDENEYAENIAAWDSIREMVIGAAVEEEPAVASPVASPAQAASQAAQEIDMTDSARESLKKAIYLTLKSSLSHEEAAHKLLTRFKLDPIELANMVVECCVQDKYYGAYYGNLASRLSDANRRVKLALVESFKTRYDDASSMEVGKLRNFGQLYAHLVRTESLSLVELVDFVVLSASKTNPSKRVLLKEFFVALRENLGLEKLKKILFKKKATRKSLIGLFPKESKHRLRFSINFFTAIGLGALTERMRAALDKAPDDETDESEIESSSSSSSDDDDDDSSDDDDSDSSSDDEPAAKRAKTS